VNESTPEEIAAAKAVRGLAANIIALCEGWPPHEIAAALAMALGFVLATEMDEPHDVLEETYDQLTAIIDDFRESLPAGSL
jgi:hypothetical protein